MDLLTSSTVAILGIQRLLPAKLIPHFATMAAGLISHVEIGVVVVDFVWCSELPLVELALRAAVVAVVTVADIG